LDVGVDVLLLRHFDTYVERSLSGTGCKAYFRADPAFSVGAKRDEHGVELYTGRRFFALTGEALAEAGHLRVAADGKAQRVERVPGIGPRRVYVLRASILGDGGEP
jgi:primase-polymerase (primpol)-like protein